MSDDDGGSPLPADTSNANGNPQVQTVLEQADENTLRVMLSTDNHLGYAERDPVRGMYCIFYCYTVLLHCIALRSMNDVTRCWCCLLLSLNQSLTLPIQHV
jgi:hypothetical protein